MSQWIEARALTKDSIQVKDAGTLPEGAFLVCLRRPRNIKHHRKYWGLVRSIVEATGRWPSEIALHRWIKWELGYYQVVRVSHNEVVIEWDSIDFSSMDQLAFSSFYDLAIAAIAIETGIYIDDLKEV